MAIAGNKKQQIAFAVTTSPDTFPESILLLIVPSNDGWNDFGFRVHAKIGFRTPGGSFEWVNGYLAFKDQKDSRVYLKSQLAGLDRDVMFPSDTKTPFVTLLSNVRSYGLMVSVLGPDLASLLATKAHDVACLNTLDKEVPGWLDFSQSAVFNQSFMRVSEAAFAFENAGKIFRGGTLDSEDSRADFSANLLINATARVTLDLKFPASGLAPSRMAAIIGRNGRGKTATLRALSRALLDRKARSGTIEPRLAFNQILVFAHSRSIRRFKISERSARAQALQIFSLDPTRGVSKDVGLTRLFARLARDAGGLVDAVSVLDEILREEFSGIQLLVPTLTSINADVAYMPIHKFFRTTEGNKLAAAGVIDLSRALRFEGANGGLRTLSLGQDVFFNFLMNAIGRSGPACTFLIDEPENFLHPNLISKFMRILNSVLEETRSIAILATHSPFVVREMSSSQVHVIDRAEDGAPIVLSPRLQTFGANVGAISDEIFGDDMVDHLYQKLLNQISNSGKEFAEIYELSKSELSLDAWMILRDMFSRVEDEV